MIRDQLTRWAADQPAATALITLAILAVLTGVVVLVVRRTSGAVLIAGLGALLATAFSGDTSWRFAGHQLGMADTERAALFAAGEVALLACAVMARANKRATATDTEAGTPGTPGVLVWCITGVQIIPAFAESGPLGGIVRTVFGPVMAALLWHLAMGLEIRVRRPDALSTGLPALIGRELRERLLSYLGLATRDRSAEQITRDRWTLRAVDHAARLADLRPGTRRHTRRARRLSRAVAHAQVGSHPEQRQQLLQLLSARLHSRALATLDLPSPWDTRRPTTPPRPAPVIAYRELREMQPVDAVIAVATAHPGAQPDEARAILADHGVIVSDTQVRIGMRLAAPPHPRALSYASAAGQTLFRVHAHWDQDSADDPCEDDPDAGRPDADAPDEDADADEADAAADLALLPDAQRVDTAHHARTGRPAGLRALQKQLRIGQPRAQRMRALLDSQTRKAG